MGLQWACKEFTISLQWVCNWFAMDLQRACSAFSPHGHIPGTRTPVLTFVPRPGEPPGCAAATLPGLPLDSVHPGKGFIPLSHSGPRPPRFKEKQLPGWEIKDPPGATGGWKIPAAAVRRIRRALAAWGCSGDAQDGAVTEALEPPCNWNQKGGESRLGNQPGEVGSHRVPLIPASLPGFLLPLLLGLRGAADRFTTGLQQA